MHNTNITTKDRMNAAHTPGRLALHDNMIVAPEAPPRTWGANNEFSGPLIVCQPRLYTTPDRDVSDANARRLAAAWNACRHMTTDQIEALVAQQDAADAANAGSPCPKFEECQAKDDLTCGNFGCAGKPR